MSENPDRASAVRDVRRHAARARQAQAALHAGIRRAAWSAPQSQIAAAVGLSKTRVNQIIHGRSR